MYLCMCARLFGKGEIYLRSYILPGMTFERYTIVLDFTTVLNRSAFKLLFNENLSKHLLPQVASKMEEYFNLYRGCFKRI